MFALPLMNALLARLSFVLLAFSQMVRGEVLSESMASVLPLVISIMMISMKMKTKRFTSFPANGSTDDFFIASILGFCFNLITPPHL